MKYLVSVCLVALATSASAQQAVISPQPSAAITGVGTPGVVRAGTEVILTMSEPLSTEGKKLREGQRVQLSVAEPVLLNGVVVIPAGSPAVGEITDVRNKGMWGKSGRINGRVLFVRVGDRQIRLTGAFDDKGVTGTAGVVAAVVFIPVAGFFMTGTSARIAAGATVKGFLDEDLTVAFAQAAPPAPLVIAAPAVASATKAPTALQPALVTKASDPTK